MKYYPLIYSNALDFSSTSFFLFSSLQVVRIQFVNRRLKVFDHMFVAVQIDKNYLQLMIPIYLYLPLLEQSSAEYRIRGLLDFALDHI